MNIWDFKVAIRNMLKHLKENINTLYFSDKMHRAIRHTYVLAENRKKPPCSTTSPHLPPAASRKLHSDYKMHPHFPPKFGGEVCVILY